LGNTRCYAFGGVMPTMIPSTFTDRLRFRRVLSQSTGSIGWYTAGGDTSIDYATRARFAGSGSNSLRWGGTGQPGDQPFTDEGRISRSIFKENAVNGVVAASFYAVNDNSVINAGSSINQFIRSSANTIPATPSDLALMCRPQPGEEGRGCLTPSGHMRPLGAFPDAPGVTLTPTPGGFAATVATVPGALEYGIRYRVAGTSGAWVRAFEETPSFTAANLGSQIAFDVQTWVKTADGLSVWSDNQSVTTGAIGAVAVPSMTIEPVGTGISQFAKSVNQPWTPAAAPNGTTVRTTLLAAKHRSGSTGGSAGVSSMRFSDSAGGSMGSISSLAGAINNQTPGGQFRTTRIGTGTPAADATHMRLEMSANSNWAGYMASALWGVPVTPAVVATSSGGSLSLANVPPGARILVLLLRAGTTPGTWSASNGAASPPAVVSLASVSDLISSDCQVEIVTVGAPTGGIFTISNSGSGQMTAVAFVAG
jgi:hypothetical protein